MTTRVVPHVVRNPANPWWNRRLVRAAASAKTLAEGVCNAESLPRNEKVGGSIPTGAAARLASEDAGLASQLGPEGLSDPSAYPARGRGNH